MSMSEKKFLKRCLLMITPLSLATCGEQRPISDPQSEIPDLVNTMVARQLAPDDERRILQSGNFQITARTLFCEHDALIDGGLRGMGVSGVGLPRLEYALKNMKQSDYLDGSPRVRSWRSGLQCRNQRSNVQYKGFLSKNRDGKPYRLTIAIWQGRSAWVGTIERRGKLSGEPLPPIDMPISTAHNATAEEQLDSLTENAIFFQNLTKDIADIAEAFITTNVH